MYTSPVNGILANYYILQKAAEMIQDADSEELIEAQIDMIIASHGVKANIVSLTTIDSIQQTVLDIFA